jgi:hypothetical protein
VRYTLPLLLALISATAVAQVYQRTGPDGQIEFSDQPGPDAEPVDVGPVQTISVTPALPTGSANRRADPAADTRPGAPVYSSLQIVSPSADEGVRANDGNVTVQVALQPSLQGGHRVAVTLDGEAGRREQSTQGMQAGFTGLARGRYTASARVLDNRGNTLISAEPVGFNVLRAFVRRSPR